MATLFSKKTGRIKIGVAQYTACSIEEDALERTAKLGFAGLEPMIDSLDSEYLQWSPADIARFVRRAEALNIELPTTAVSIFNGNDALITQKERKNTVSIIRQSLAFSALIGAKTMLLCTFFASNPDNQEKRNNLIEILRQVEPTARDLNVAIGLETPLPAKTLMEIVNTIESKHVGVYYDVGNAIFLGYDPAVEIQQLGHHILALHIKDTTKNLGDSHLGEGRLDLDSAMAALDKINYRGWLILETLYGNDIAIQKDYRTIKEYLQRMNA